MKKNMKIKISLLALTVSSFAFAEVTPMSKERGAKVVEAYNESIGNGYKKVSEAKEGFVSAELRCSKTSDVCYIGVIVVQDKKYVDMIKTNKKDVELYRLKSPSNLLKMAGFFGSAVLVGSYEDVE